MRIVSSVTELTREGEVWFGEGSGACRSESVRWGIAAIDEACGGVSVGAVHEFSSADECAPLALFACLVGQVLRESLPTEISPAAALPLVVWVGRICFPTPHLLDRLSQQQGDPSWHWTRHCLFLDVSDKRERFSGALAALLSPTVLLTVADGRGFDFVATRRLQLAAKKRSALIFLSRAPRELTTRSAARTRWQLTPTPTSGEHPTWKLELLRAPGLVSTREWFIQWNGEADEENTLSLLPHVDDRSDRSEIAVRQR